MAYMTEDFSYEIEKIIREFQDEMSRIEVSDILSTPRRTNLSGDYIKQKQAACAERANALRRALYRVLGTEEQQEQMFMSPAQRAAQGALEEPEDRINSRGGITTDVDF